MAGSKEAMETTMTVSLVVVSAAILVLLTATPGAASKWSIQLTSPAVVPNSEHGTCLVCS